MKFRRSAVETGDERTRINDGRHRDRSFEMLGIRGEVGNHRVDQVDWRAQGLRQIG
jgi:hypothetical protein